MTATLRNPFIGLRSFESHESLLYFGRQDQTLELLKRLHQHHFVAVVGGSGSGKSSLVKAGVIPGLKAGYIVKSRDKWAIASMRPGQSPMRNLIEAILLNLDDKTLNADQLLSCLKEDGIEALINMMKPLWQEKLTNFFLLVDQFEELFRFSLNDVNVQRKDEANEFVNTLLLLCQQPDLPIYIIITMRSDFIGDCAQFYGLPESLNQSQYLVPRLTRTQLKSSIESPIELFGGKINANLTSRLLNDAMTAQDELPLLQHALMRIWQEEYESDKNGVLDLDDYARIGSLEKALSNHAEAAYKSANEEDQLIIKKIFQALTTTDANARKIRRPAYMKQLIELTGAAEEKVLELIRKFIDGNRCFLVIDDHGADKLIDISHESLIRRWSTLSQWADEEQENKKKLEQLILFQHLDPNGTKRLLSGAELQQVIKWHADLNPVSEWGKQYSNDYAKGFDYLTLSQAKWVEDKKNLERKRKWKYRRLVYGFIALVALSIVSFDLYRAAKDKAYTNRKIENYLLNTQNAFKESKDVKGLHLFAEALILSEKPDTILHRLLKNDSTARLKKTVNPLYSSERSLPQFVLQKIINQNVKIITVLLSEDDAHVATVNTDGYTRYWDLKNNTMLDSVASKPVDSLPGAWKMINNVELIPSGIYYDSLSSVWGIEANPTFENLGKGPVNYLQVTGLQGSNDNKVVIWGRTSESYFDAATIWSTTSGEQVGNAIIKELIDKAFFGPNNNHIYVYGDSTLQVWKNIRKEPFKTLTITSDLDIPANLFKLQIQAVTGVKLELIREDLQPLSVSEWRDLSRQFNEQGAAHYKVCKYKKFNYWQRIFGDNVR